VLAVVTPLLVAIYMLSASAAQVAQTITFAPLDDATYVDAPVTLVATASSGLPVSFPETGPCSVSGHELALVGAGHCTVTVSQSGNDDRLAAPDASETIGVAPSAGLVTVTGIVYDDEGPITSARADRVSLRFFSGPSTAPDTVLDPIDFTDAGAKDTHDVMLDWGDGSSTGATIGDDGTSASPSHVYMEPGQYEITVTITDDDGGTGSRKAVASVRSDSGEEATPDE
jgi:PKD repeat protein